MRTRIDSQIVKQVLINTEYKSYEVAPVDEGVSTDVFKLTKKNTILYLRIIPKEESIQAQVTAHTKLIKLGLKIPEVLFFEENVEEFNNRSYMIVTEIKGKSIKSTKDILSEKELEQILFEAGKELAIINSIEVKDVGWIINAYNNEFYAEGKDYNDFVINRMPIMLTDLVNLQILTLNQQEKIIRFTKQNKGLIDITKISYLAHGDFDLSHIYQKDGKYTGIIDFGDIRGTTKFHDLAHFYTFNHELFYLLKEGYETVYKLPQDYSKRLEIEAVLFGISKLWWISKTQPQKLSNHPILKVLNDTCN